jgi:putative nucleotidyltransferase with HDIG domain
VLGIAQRLLGAGHTAYLVGGAVRDALLGRPPHDYDLATDALPEQVLALFPRGVADDAAFGRVLVDGVDVLTLRREGEYKDRRRPSRVVFSRSIRADLARRDFTVNAMAVDLSSGVLVDPFGGRRDLALGILRTVGRPEQRFAEDALRVLRAVRLRAQLGFSYHPRLAEALRVAADTEVLEALSAERVRDELTAALLAPDCGLALRDLRRYGLLGHVLPECLPMVGCEQRNPMHLYDVWEHSVRAAEAVAAKPHLRWAALLHDVGKPACRTVDAEGMTHFYGHELVGADVAARVLRRLRFPERFVARVAALVRHHMFSYAPETKIGAARRLVLALGRDGARDLVELRRADRQASRWGQGYGPEGERLLSHLRALEEAGERFTLRDLAVDGRDVMQALGVGPGPLVGAALRRLHQLVLDDALPNRREELLRWLAEHAAEVGAQGPPGRGQEVGRSP